MVSLCTEAVAAGTALDKQTLHQGPHVLQLSQDTASVPGILTHTHTEIFTACTVNIININIKYKYNYISINNIYIYINYIFLYKIIYILIFI